MSQSYSPLRRHRVQTQNFYVLVLTSNCNSCWGVTRKPYFQGSASGSSGFAGIQLAHHRISQKQAPYWPAVLSMSARAYYLGVKAVDPSRRQRPLPVTSTSLPLLFFFFLPFWMEYKNDFTGFPKKPHTFLIFRHSLYSSYFHTAFPYKKWIPVILQNVNINFLLMIIIVYTIHFLRDKFVRRKYNNKWAKNK